MGTLLAANPYAEEQIEQKKLFLIICEGENTEPYYFSSFRVPSKAVIVHGGKGSKNTLIDYALKMQQDPDYAGREIWCVYDYDVKPDEAATQPKDFNSSIDKAYANSLKVAWSNDAFELWFLLHYHKMDNALTREEIYKILKERWGARSREIKTVTFSKDHYKRHGGELSEGQALAIRRASELHDKFKGRKDYANHCPCTTVYQLVEELNRNLKD